MEQNKPQKIGVVLFTDEPVASSAARVPESNATRRRGERREARIQYRWARCVNIFRRKHSSSSLSCWAFLFSSRSSGSIPVLLLCRRKGCTQSYFFFICQCTSRTTIQISFCASGTITFVGAFFFCTTWLFPRRPPSPLVLSPSPRCLLSPPVVVMPFPLCSTPGGHYQPPFGTVLSKITPTLTRMKRRLLTL